MLDTPMGKVLAMMVEWVGTVPRAVEGKWR